MIDYSSVFVPFLMLQFSNFHFHKEYQTPSIFLSLPQQKKTFKKLLLLQLGLFFCNLDLATVVAVNFCSANIFASLFDKLIFRTKALIALLSTSAMKSKIFLADTSDDFEQNFIFFSENKIAFWTIFFLHSLFLYHVL